MVYRYTLSQWLQQTRARRAALEIDERMKQSLRDQGYEFKTYGDELVVTTDDVAAFDPDKLREVMNNPPPWLKDAVRK